MPLSPLGKTLIRMTLGVACHPRPWTPYTVEPHREKQVIISLDNTSQTTPSVACLNHLSASHIIVDTDMTCQHLPCGAHTFTRRQVLDSIIAPGKQTRSKNVWRFMPSRLLTTHTSGVRCHYCMEWLHGHWEA